jgi:transposase
MEVSSLLALPDGLRVERIELQGDLLVMVVVSGRPSSCCPLCAQASSQVHSQYQRTLRDVSCGGRKVVLHLFVRKFFCRNQDCARKIFTERLLPFVRPWAQVTTRLFEAVQAIGLATSGELATRLADRIGIHSSPTTTLRRIMALPLPSSSQVSLLGIDDWSFRRGRKFGTILVDLATHHILDLLPDRTAETAAAWMRKHPEIEVVSRDRGGEYASAAAAGAPQATQCADRFHMIKNLREALEGVLARHLAAHRNGLTEKSSTTPLLAGHPRLPPKLSPKEAHQKQARREERLALYHQVVALRKLGFSQTAIANQVGIGHATVSRWLGSGTFPEQQPRARRTHLDPHLPFLRERWEAGCHTIAQLYRNSWPVATPTRMNRCMNNWFACAPLGRKNPQASDLLPRPPLLARDASFLFLRRSEELSAEEQETLLMLRSLHAEVNQAYELVQQFAQMLRTRTGEYLDTWLAQARASQIREVQSFVLGIERDKAAVFAGLTLPHSNGIGDRKGEQAQAH